MTDIVERLRRGNNAASTVLLGGMAHDMRCLEAAKEIVRLRQALEDLCMNVGTIDQTLALKRARAALEIDSPSERA